MTEVKRGSIWLANLSPTMGREQAGTRPVLVTSSDYFNKGFSQLVFAVPITSKNRHIRSHIPLLPPEGGLEIPSFIICEAMRSVSKQRLIKHLGAISIAKLLEVDETLKILLDL